MNKYFPSLLAVVFAALPLQAASVTLDPVQYNGAAFFLDFTITNDDNGAVYDKGTINFVTTLAADIHALGNSTEPTPLAMVQNEWHLDIRPSSEVNNGWSYVPKDNGAGLPTIDMVNNGFAPDLSYTTWQNENSNSTQNDFAGRVWTQFTVLEQNSIAGHQPMTIAAVSSAGFDPADFDLTIVRSDDPLLLAANYTGSAPAGDLVGAFVGDLGGPSISATAPQYVALLPSDFTTVPEPASAALLGIGGLALIFRRKAKK